MSNRGGMRRRSGAGRIVAFVVAAVAIVALIVAIGLFACSRIGGTSDNGSAGGGGAEQRVSFVAVGDNLPDIEIGAYADASSGSTGDGTYDYAPVYAAIKPYIEAADLAYMSQETHLGGDTLGVRGYPSFNTPDSMAQTIASVGFDLVATASNHCYDWGNYGAAEHNPTVWAQTEGVVATGTATSAEQAAEIATIERNGITFAFLAYTYGLNGFSRDDVPAYAVDFMDEDLITDDVNRAKEISDVVIVAMHWGTENVTQADDEQVRYAQLCADLGVDIVIGSHPHVIQPVQWVQGAAGNQTLVAYSLGNFISNHNSPAPINQLEGMLTCDFVKSGGTVRIENVAWTSLVMHCEPGAYAVYTLADYTEELAAKNVHLEGLESPLAWFESQTEQIIGTIPATAPEATFDADNAASSATATLVPAATDAGRSFLVLKIPE